MTAFRGDFACFVAGFGERTNVHVTCIAGTQQMQTTFAMRIASPNTDWLA